MDVARLTDDWMTHGKKALDEDAVRTSPTELYYGVTRADQINSSSDPEEEFINAKTAEPGMLAAMKASMSVTMVAGQVPPVNGIEYNDGAFDPLAIGKLIEQFKPTDILILPNTPFDRLDTFELSKSQRVIAELIKGLGQAGSLLSLNQLEKFLRIKEQMRKSIDTIQKENNVNIGFLFPPDSGLDSLKQDSLDMKEAVLRSARGVFDAFGMQQPHEIPLYESEGSEDRADSSFGYEATPEQIERTRIFLDIMRKLEAAQVRYAVTGSFGLDGLYGSQTRANGDIDILLADQTEVEKASAILAEQGIEHRTTKSSGGDIFIHVPTATEIGLKTLERVREYSDADISLFIPESPNAQLKGVAFKTPTIEGHELYNAIQQQRADKFGWGEYRHRAHRDRLIERIKAGR